MNPLTNVKNITKLNEIELASGSIHKKSWHDMYKDSAWIFIGGLEYGLTEGDVLAVFSQYGEIENINLVRDKKTGKSKGFCFLCYSNQKSTILAVDNFNGTKLCSRTIRVDHVANYKPPKENERDDDITKMLKFEGCAPEIIQKHTSNAVSDAKSGQSLEMKDKKKKSKKEKKEKKKKKRKNKSDANDLDQETSTIKGVEVKKEKHDPGYDKYDTLSHGNYSTVKRRHTEKNLNDFNNDYSHSQVNDESKIEKKKFKTEKNDVLGRNRSGIKTEPKSDDNDDDIHQTSSRRHKRAQSSSSSSDNHAHNSYKEKSRHKSNRHESKRHSKHKRKYKESKDSTSSSSDDASSTQSSSEDEKHESRNSRKDKYQSFQEDNKERNYHRIENSYTYGKSRHYDKIENRDKHKSRTKYDNIHHEDSHYRKRK